MTTWDDAIKAAVELRAGQPSEPPPADATIEIARLAKLSALDYERARTPAAKALGIRTSALDAEVAKARPSDPEEPNEVVETLEPWREPVDGAALAEEVRNRLRAHVVFAHGTDADALTIWIFGTYLMQVWRLWPKVLISSPTKRCGKSTLLEGMEALVHRGMMCSNITSAALFRSIEKWCPSLLIDEADRFLRDKEEINGIINSGHARRTAFVNRCVEVNGEQDVRRFSVWCPQVFAGIGSQADTLVDRSIVINLKRKMEGEPVERLPFDLHERMTVVRRKLARWAADNAILMRASDAEPPACGNDRRRDNFTPLWRIAAALGGPWPARISAAYAAQAASEEDDRPAGEMLLHDVLEVFNRRGGSSVSTADLIADLIAQPDAPWAEWNRGRPMTAHQLSRMLRPFGVHPRTVRVLNKTPKGYARESVWSAYCRYIPPQTATLPQSNDFSDLRQRETATLTPDVAVSNGANQLKNHNCGGVAELQRGADEECPWIIPDEPVRLTKTYAGAQFDSAIRDAWADFEAQGDPLHPEAWR